MSETSVRAILNTSLSADSAGGTRLWKAELQKAWTEAQKPEAGEPAGKPLTAGEAKLFEDLKEANLSKGAKELLEKILAQIPSLLQTVTPPPAGEVIVLPPKRGQEVHLTKGAGFAADATGAAPASQLELCAALYRAGEWIQGSFGSNDNLFSRAALDPAGKRAVLAQIKDAVATNLDELNHQQVDQHLGATGAVLAELFKSVQTPPLVPSGQGEQDRALRAEIFATLVDTVKHARMNVRIRRALVGYLHKADSVQKLLEPGQKSTLAELYRADHPERPFDYDTWDANQKSVIRIDHACGEGEGFLFGFVKQLQKRGLDRNGTAGSTYDFELVQGDVKYGPALLRVTIAADDPLNKWGREMTVEINVRNFRNDMYKAMADANVDIVSYGGHSNFGGNTLASLKNAPQQVGEKVIARDLCCGIDTTNAEARLFPDGSNNSVTSINSSYFRTTTDQEMGKYANDSEGYHMLMAITRGVLAKKSWKQIGADLKQEANWWGHDSDNNWMYPGDARRDGARDDDEDGIPNVFDVMPGVNATAVQESTSKEFQLKVPGVAAAELGAGRAFQALQFVNTATNYNTELDELNSQRKLVPHPQGMWFDGLDEPNTYVKISAGSGGKTYVQLSSALSTMTMETMRAVLYFEAAKFYAQKHDTLRDKPVEALTMALLFAASSLVYDQGWRDAPVFNGLKRIYGIPDSVDFSSFESQVLKCEERHNYTGDMTAVRALAAEHREALAAAGVGEPAVTVTA